ncbi:MAG TPA: monovalent cation/H+ antiporter complex subunit F [Fusibacter sp.]|nr:monovalent cation/H+ antiporter complex subunit F [Fusibacter sp.]
MNLAIFILIALTSLSLIRVIIGPTIWDRLLGLNLITSKIIMFLVVLAYVIDKTYILDFAIIYALLGFIGIMFIAINVQRKGKL